MLARSTRRGNYFVTSSFRSPVHTSKSKESPMAKSRSLRDLEECIEWVEFLDSE